MVISAAAAAAARMSAAGVVLAVVVALTGANVRQPRARRGRLQPHRSSRFVVSTGRSAVWALAAATAVAVNAAAAAAADAP